MRQAQKISSIGIGAAVILCAIEPVWGNPTPVSAERLTQQSSNAVVRNGKAPAPDRIAQTPATTTPTPSILVPNPEIRINGNPVSGAGAVPVPVSLPAPPFLPRAIAPPVGDISVSNIDPSNPIVDLSTTATVPRLVLKDAPVREVLELLARSAGLNLAFIGASTAGQTAPGGTGAQAASTITLNLENEPVQNVFNYVLQISGLQANRVGSTIFAGSELPQGVRNLITRSFRLNQVSAAGAATFLSAQGAETQRVLDQVAINTVGAGVTARTVETRTTSIQPLAAATGTGPLLLRGLSVLTDERLNAITLVGEPHKVQIATTLLVQLDARRRQVAVNVKIVDVNLLNTQNFNTSFSFGIGQGFLTVDNGAAAFSFGGVRPPTAAQVAASPVTPPIIANPFAGANVFLDPNNPILVPGTTPGTVNIDQRPGGGISSTGRGTGSFPGSFVNLNNPLSSGITNITLPTDNITTITPGVGGAPATVSTTQGTASVITTALPSLFQFPTRFLSLLQAQIQSGNAKILTDPTLVVQEGDRSTVNLSQEVFAGFRLEYQAVGTTTVPVQVPIIKDAGLILDIQVARIDDNGFVTLSVNPTVSAPASSAATSQGTITLLQKRQLQSGQIRLRDGQTLILSGIIQQSDQTTVTKVPILGDIPILGALFRSTNRQNQRQEVIVLLTPQIIDDSAGSSFGYNYTPGTDARQLLQPQGSPNLGGNR